MSSELLYRRRMMLHSAMNTNEKSSEQNTLVEKQ